MPLSMHLMGKLLELSYGVLSRRFVTQGDRLCREGLAEQDVVTQCYRITNKGREVLKEWRERTRTRDGSPS